MRLERHLDETASRQLGETRNRPHVGRRSNLTGHQAEVRQADRRTVRRAAPGRRSPRQVVDLLGQVGQEDLLVTIVSPPA